MEGEEPVLRRGADGSEEPRGGESIVEFTSTHRLAVDEHGDGVGHKRAPWSWKSRSVERGVSKSAQRVYSNRGRRALEVSAGEVVEQCAVLGHGLVPWLLDVVVCGVEK